MQRLPLPILPTAGRTSISSIQPTPRPRRRRRRFQTSTWWTPKAGGDSDSKSRCRRSSYMYNEGRTCITRVNTPIYWSILRELAGNIQYQYLESAKTIFWYLLIQHRSWLVAAKAFQHRSWLAACCVPVAPDPFIGRGVPEFSCFPRFSHVLNRILTECSN